jgi:plasmid stabilization system protein ParE
MRVEWTLHAVDTVAAIRNYIAQQSPRYAQRMVERIVSRCRQLVRFPASGQMVPEYQNVEVREISKAPTASSIESTLTAFAFSPSFTVRGRCRRIHPSDSQILGRERTQRARELIWLIAFPAPGAAP